MTDAPTKIVAIPRVTDPAKVRVVLVQPDTFQSVPLSGAGIPTLGGDNEFTGDNSFTGSNTITGYLPLSGGTLSGPLAITGNSIELGRVDGVAGASFLDFHSGATLTDFDARVLSTGGDGTSAGGTLQIRATPVELTQGQLKFSSANNPSADPNTIDDYEEGLWTPDLQFGNAKVGIAYSKQIGTYVKIGKTVTLWWEITLTAKGTSVGSAVIWGAPFTVSSTGSTSFGGSMGYANGFVTTTGGWGCYVSSGTTGINPTVSNNAAGGFLAGINDTVFTNTSRLIGSISYPTTT
jgi:hypothetical protein